MPDEDTPSGGGAPPADTAAPADVRDVWHRLAFQPSRPHLVIGLLFAVLGLLATVAIVRPGTDDRWRTARTEDLVQILDDLTSRQQRLDAEVTRLTGLQRDLEAGSTVEAAAEARRRLAALQVLTGTTPVSGPGLSIVISDPTRQVDASVVLDAVQELRDAGAEVIYTGLRRSPAQIAQVAVDEGVDALGLSILSGSHKELVADVIAELGKHKAGDVKVFVGGTIPGEDHAFLRQLGVSAVFTADMPLDAVVAQLAAALP